MGAQLPDGYSQRIMDAICLYGSAITGMNATMQMINTASMTFCGPNRAETVDMTDTPAKFNTLKMTWIGV